MDEDERRLFAYTATRENGAAFSATRNGSLALVRPLTPKAMAWLSLHVTNEVTWEGDDMVVEMRYFPILADAIMAAGFTFERNTLPN